MNCRYGIFENFHLERTSRFVHVSFWVRDGRCVADFPLVGMSTDDAAIHIGACLGEEVPAPRKNTEKQDIFAKHPFAVLWYARPL